MNRIVCATRGGEGSRAAQMAAINRAKVEGAHLTFLYITDPNNLGEIDDALVTAVRQELNWLGNALLNMAKTRASGANLVSDVVIREGNVREEIGRYLQAHQANLLLLGAPRGTTANVFGDDAVEKFAATITESTGIPVEIIRPETYG